jgi:hypothetical protein
MQVFRRLFVCTICKELKIRGVYAVFSDKIILYYRRGYSTQLFSVS